MENEREEGIGEIQIANEVVAAIASIAASEIEGVETLSGNIKNELVGRFGAKKNAKGVKVTVDDNEAIVDIAITMKYGYSIPETSGRVQERISQAVNEMTGLICDKVNVTIAGVSLPKD